MDRRPWCKCPTNSTALLLLPALLLCPISTAYSAPNGKNATIALVQPNGEPASDVTFFALDANGVTIKPGEMEDGMFVIKGLGDKVTLGVTTPGKGTSYQEMQLPDRDDFQILVYVAPNGSIHGKVLPEDVSIYSTSPANSAAKNGAVTANQTNRPKKSQTHAAAATNGTRLTYSTPNAARGGADGADACASASAITGTGAFPFSLVGATTDGVAHAACLSFGEDQIENDVWFCWTAPCSGPARVESCGGTTVDTRIAVYNGCACPGSDGTLLGCNDDTCSLQSRVDFTAVSGNTYLIRVGVFPGAAVGGGNLAITCSGGGGGGGNGGGSDCATAEAIAGQGTFNFDQTGTTTDGPSHAACTFFGQSQIENDVWFCWTADCTADAVIQTCSGTTTDTKIAVYNGCACPASDGTLLVCNDDACALQSRVQFAATAGNTYLIRIGTFPGEPAGTGTFQISCQTPPGPPPECLNAITCQIADQQGHGAGGTLAATSDVAAGFLSADNFKTTGGGSVSSVCWWGIYFNFGAGADCAPGPGDNFQITYYNDGGSVPGSVLAGPFSVTAAKGPTGNLLLGIVAEYLFEASHPPVALAADTCYWIEITNTLDGTCVWLWSAAPPGDGRSAQDAGGYAATDYDLAFCLDTDFTLDGCGVAPPPGNDDCANAAPIAGQGAFPFDNSSATTDGPPHAGCTFFGCDQTDFDLWYCWTADCTGTVVVETCGLTGVDTKIVVYDGCACPVNDAHVIACNDDACSLQSRVSFAATSGQQYLIRLGTFCGGPPGSGQFQISCQGPPPTCAAAITCQIADQQGHGAGGVLAATSDPNAGFVSAENFSPTSDSMITTVCWWGIYFDFGAGADCSPGTGDNFTITYYTDGGAVPGAVHAGPFAVSVTKGPTGNVLLGIANEYLFQATHAPVAVLADECYWIEIANTTTGTCFWLWSTAPAGDDRSAQDGGTGYASVDYDMAFCLDIDFAPDGCGALPPPPNDDCSGAIMVACNSQTVADNSSATTDPTDPGYSCHFDGAGTQGTATIWYTFVATDTEVEIDTCLSTGATATDSLIGLYSGTCGNLTELACSEDACSLLSSLCYSGLTVGQTYYIQLASYSAASRGVYTLRVQCPCGATGGNDNCTGAVGPLAVPSSTNGTTVGATTDVGFPTCGTGSVTSPGVWYTVIGTGNTMTASTCNAGTSYDNKLNVYCGPCDAPVCVGGVDDACGLQAEVTWCSQAGATYRILVHGFGGSTGPFQLDISDNGVACVAPVQCLGSGACCVNGNCQIATASECQSLGGTYLGDDTPCGAPVGNPQNYTSNPNVAIPDANPAGVDDVINVGDSFTVGDVNVRVQIPDHTWLSDLRITLTHGAQTVVILDSLCPQLIGLDVTFDDEGGVLVCGSPTVGTFRPSGATAGSLSAFDGMDSSGAWTLNVSDNVGADVGTLVSWTLTLDEQGSNPCPPPAACDDCPPGSIRLNDAMGNFSGWCVTVNDPAAVDIFVDLVNVNGGFMLMQVSKDYNYPPGFGGIISPILMDFVQVCPDELTVPMIYIADESITNNTGVTWTDFHWSLFDGGQVWFDIAASSAFDTTPFVNKHWNGLIGPNQAKSLDVDGGALPSGGTFFPGEAGGELKISVDLSGSLPVSFTLKERPTTGPSGACCLPTGECSITTPEACGTLGGMYQGDDTTCDPNPCAQPTGACCASDGSCSEVTEADCMAAGGSYQGDGTSCTPNPCPQPTGACCASDGSCSEVTEADCMAAGGSYQGDGSSCTPNPCPQPGDDCALALPIACDSTVVVDNTNFTTDPSDPEFSCFFLAPDQGTGTIWLTFVATDTSAEVSLCGSSVSDTLVAVYSGTCGNLTEIACNDDNSQCTGFTLRSKLCVTGLTVGNTYYIQAASFSDSSRGLISVQLTCPCPSGACCFAGGACQVLLPSECSAQGGNYQGDNTTCSPNPCPQTPANDLCENCTSVTVPFSQTGVNLPAATNDLDVTCNASANTATRNGVWYCYTPPSNCTLAIAVTGPDTVIAVFTGTCGNLTQIQCSDPQTLQFAATAGTTYRILIGMWSATTAPTLANVTIDCIFPPANDACGSATAISGTGNFAFDNRLATTDGPSHVGAPCSFTSNNQINKDVWFCWTAACTGNALIETCPTNLDARLAVYDGCVCPPTTLLACNDDAGGTCGTPSGFGSRVTLAVTAGNQYLIRIGNFSSSASVGASGMFTIACPAPIAPSTAIEGMADVRPGKCPNLVNPNASTLLPLAIVGQAGFDATLVDPASVRIARIDDDTITVAPYEGVGAGATPQMAILDMATPYTGLRGGCHDLTGDGVPDLMLNFRTSAMLNRLKLDDVTPGETVELLVTGRMLNGEGFKVVESVTVVSAKGGDSLLRVRSNEPNAWVDVDVADACQDLGGFATFERVYNNAEAVLVTAPENAGGRPFAYWRVNGQPQPVGQRTVVITTNVPTNDVEAVFGGTFGTGGGLNPLPKGPINRNPNR